MIEGKGDSKGNQKNPKEVEEIHPDSTSTVDLLPYAFEY